MVYPPVPSPYPHPVEVEEQDDLWPLRPEAAVKKRSVDRSMRSSPSSHGRRPSSVPSSITRIGSPEDYKSLRGETPSPSDEEISKPEYDELTALPTISSKPGPLCAAVGAVQGTIRNLQDAPTQKLQTNPKDPEGEPIMVFKPGKGVYMAFAVLANLTIMVALDSTALSVALPVRLFVIFDSITNDSGHRRKIERNCATGVLGRCFLPAQLDSLSAYNRTAV